MRRLVLVMAGVLWAAPAVAQEPAIPLTLEDAIARGLANSLRIAELQARSEGAEAAEAGRRAAALPLLAVTGGYTRTNHVDPYGLPGIPPRIIYPDVPDNVRARLDLQWPIYTGGRTQALERAAKAERLASVEEIAAARADLRLEITRAFWALVTAKESEQVVARALETLGAHVRDLRNRLEQGLIPPNDVLSAEAQESRQRLLAIDAKNLRSVADADLRRLLGADEPGEFQPVVPPGAAAPAPTDASPLIAAAKASRPERRALEDRAASARARVDASHAAAFPQVAVAGGYDYARPNPRIFPRAAEWNPSWDLSVNATWQLWDGGRRRADEAEAAAAVRATESRVGDFDRQVTFEVRQRMLDLDSSHAAIAAASDGVRSATEALRVVTERFAAGVATNTDVLDAQVAMLQAELERTRAVANSHLAEARLARAVGK
ncbi:MAG TPA: TolC family protein [Vicinamibacterales bacterium]